MEALWKLRRDVVLELRNERSSRAHLGEWAKRYNLNTPWLELWAANAASAWGSAVERARERPPRQSIDADGDIYTYWERVWSSEPDRFFDLVTGAAQSCGGPQRDEHVARELHSTDVARVVGEPKKHQTESRQIDRVSLDRAGTFEFTVHARGPSYAYEMREAFLTRALEDVTTAAYERWNEGLRELRRRGYVRSPLKPQLQMHAEWTVRSSVPPVETYNEIAKTETTATVDGVRKAVQNMRRVLQLPRRSGGRPPR